MFDAHRNFAISLIATPPSPATSGTSLTVASGDGATFPAAPFNATVWPAGTEALASNAEIVRVTLVAGDTFTVVRQAELSAARSIQAGDQIAATITAKTITDIEGAAASTILTATYEITTPTVISIEEIDGAILFVEITQDGTGHSVTWDTMFEGAPAVSSSPNAITKIMFFGISGKWQLSSVTTSVGVPAPAVTATGGITGYQTWANVTVATFSGRITLPTSNPDYNHLQFIIVEAVAPPDAHGNQDRFQIARFAAPGYPSPFPGSYIDYSGYTSAAMQTGSAQSGWSIAITPYNEFYAPGTPTVISGLTIAASSITGLSATDDTADRWKDLGGALHAVIPVTVSCSNYPQMVSLWTNSPQYGRIMHGWFWVTAAGTVIRIGDKSTGTDIYPPTVAAETVTVYAAIGTYDSKIDPTTISGVASTTVSVSTFALMTSTSSSAASASVSYYTGAGGASDFLATVLFTLDLENPNFGFARLYVQTGAGTGGSFVPGGAHPVYHSGDGTIGDWTSPNGFSQAVDHGQGFSLVSTVAAGQIQATLVGPVPSDANTTLRFSLDVASWRDDGSGATKVLQYTWPGGLSYYDLVLNGALSYVAGARVSGTVPLATTAGSASNAGYSSTAGSVPGSGVTGTVTLGGGGAATTVALVKDGSGNVVCWMGQYTVSSITYFGIWASNVWIGGSGPAAAKIWLDNLGNAHFSGSIESGSTISGASLSGGSLSITTAGGAVTINSSTNGVVVTGAGGLGVLFGGQLSLNNSPYSTTVNTAGITIWNGGSLVFQVSAAGMVLNNYTGATHNLGVKYWDGANWQYCHLTVDGTDVGAMQAAYHGGIFTGTT